MVLSLLLHLRSLKGNERMGIMDEVGNGHGLYHEEGTLPPSRQSRPVLVLVCMHCTLARVNQLDHVLKCWVLFHRILPSPVVVFYTQSCGNLTCAELNS